METWTKVMVLSIGGTLGVNARYWLGAWINRWASSPFPWATFTINVTGSFLIGFLTVALTRWLPHPNMRLMVITGFLGGYTTFSTFENETLTLWERGESMTMWANVVGSVAIGFAAVLMGTVLARGLTEPAALGAADSRGAKPAGIEKVVSIQNDGDTADVGQADAPPRSKGQPGHDVRGPR